MRTAWFCLGYIAAIATMNLAMWLGDKLRRASADYAPDFVPATVDELRARREKAIKSLTESVG